MPNKHVTPRSLAMQASLFDPLPDLTTELVRVLDPLTSLWHALREAWLQMSYERSQSEHTLVSYQTGSRQWLEFLQTIGLKPWEVSTMHVRMWQTQLKDKGLNPATVNQRLAAVSSWYTFVINEVHLVDGVERCAFADATGHARSNPFKVGNLRRGKVSQYGKAHPLSPTDMARLFEHLEHRKHTLLGSRNLALITTYFLTASRNSEVVRMRWGDIRPSRSQPGSFVWAWRGKGGKSADSALPARAYEAIKAHLEIAGRWEPKPQDYIWQPIVTHGSKNLSSARHGTEHRGFIGEKNAVRILQTALRLAGVEKSEQYRVHDLRHTFAHLFQGDLETLRQILHHENLNTTGIYVRSLHDPVDTYSESIWKSIHAKRP